MVDMWWVRRALAGHKSAGEKLVVRHYAGIRCMLRCLTGDDAVADDLTQQTFVKAWQALPGYRGEASFRTWLHRIAYHEYTHWLRDRRPAAHLDDMGRLADPKLYCGLTTILLERALDEIGAEKRDAFLLYHAYGLSVGEVARLLDVPAGTVKSRLHAARAQLRVILSETAEPAGLPAHAEI